ncbi:MAG: hypothetical protein ACE5NC_07890 [Anaerolineae bacterium]
MSQGRLVGGLLIAAALVLGGVGFLWLSANWSSGQLELTGFVLGLGALLAVFVLPLLGAGVFLFVRGGQEAQALAEARRARRILDMVLSQGSVKVSEIALEMDLTRDQVRDQIYHLVGKGLFTGYVDWDGGVLYAVEAARVKTTKCPNCGGEREVVGKGIVRCPYCGVELFIT